MNTTPTKMLPQYAGQGVEGLVDRFPERQGGYEAANTAEQAGRNIMQAVSAASRGALGLAASYIQTAQIELKESYTKLSSFVMALQSQSSGASIAPEASVQAEAAAPTTTEIPAPAAKPKKKYNKTSAYWKSVGKGKGKVKGTGGVKKGSKLPEATKKKIAAAAKARKRDKSGHFIPAKKK